MNLSDYLLQFRFFDFLPDDPESYWIFFWRSMQPGSVFDRQKSSVFLFQPLYFWIIAAEAELCVRNTTINFLYS